MLQTNYILLTPVFYECLYYNDGKKSLSKTLKDESYCKGRATLIVFEWIFV